MLSDQENNGLALIFLIDKRGRELQLGGCAIIVSDPLAEPAGRSVAARSQLVAENTAKIEITQTTDNELAFARLLRESSRAGGRGRLFVGFFIGRERIGPEPDVQEPELCCFALS